MLFSTFTGKVFKSIHAGGLLALISLGGHFLGESPPNEDKKKESPSNFYMNNASLKTYDNQGKWLQNLTAKRFVHLQSTGETYLTEPILTLANNEEDFSWKIKAKKGKIRSKPGEEQDLMNQCK